MTEDEEFKVISMCKGEDPYEIAVIDDPKKAVAIAFDEYKHLSYADRKTTIIGVENSVTGHLIWKKGKVE